MKRLPQTNTTAEVAVPAPVVPQNGGSDLLAPSVLLAGAVALAGLIGWAFRQHHKLMTARRDIDENTKYVTLLKSTVEAVEIRVQLLEKQSNLLVDVQGRQDRMMEKFESKLDRIYELLTQK